MRISTGVLVYGQGVDTRSGVFGTTAGLVDEFGGGRVFDTPVSESAMTGFGLGAALMGMRPVLVHARMDFMLYSMDQIVNWASIWRFKSNGQSGMPLTIRAVVGKGWGQGPQHSKSLQAWFAHVPGLRVAVPATAFDAKGLLLEAIFGEDPTIILEGRPLFAMSEVVPEEPYRVPFGKAIIRRAGRHATLVAIGHMVPIALQAAERLAQDGIDLEVLDLRTIVPLNDRLILDSVRKTGRLILADTSWTSFGVTAELAARVTEQAFEYLKAPPIRVGLPDGHTPTSVALESAYYPDHETIVHAVRSHFIEHGSRESARAVTP
jgi:pyruvate dehydrogenase E1 component beta subunit